MRITFSPVRRDETLALSVAGDAVTVNGRRFDFGPLPDGAVLPLEALDGHWFAGPVERRDGVLRLALVLPHGPDAPAGALFPAPLEVERDGPVALPGQDEDAR